MSSSMTTKTRFEPFASRSTAPTGVDHESEQRGIVLTEGEERQGFDGPVGHRCSPGGEVVNPLGWDDTDSGALFVPDVDRICEPSPTRVIGLMIEMMRPLGWDDAETGAPTTEMVDRTRDRRPALLAGLMIGLMFEVMNPLGWAFTALVLLDPSGRWLVLSAAHEAPGWDFVGWLMERTGSVRRHKEQQPEALR
jgi:hypothetical protein